MWQNPQEAADLVTFTEEILNGKLHFLCIEWNISKKDNGKLSKWYRTLLAESIIVTKKLSNLASKQMRNSPSFLPKVDISLASDDMRIKVLLIFWNSSELHPSPTPSTPPPKKKKKEKTKQNKAKQ